MGHDRGRRAGEFPRGFPVALIKLVVSGEDETRRLGRCLGCELAAGDVVCLIGELGSGKTTFCQGLARGLGFRGQVASPTFTLVRVYRGGRCPIYHVDLYRVAPNQTLEIGLEDYLADRRAVCALEWPESGAAYLPSDRLEIRFSHGRKPSKRCFAFRGLGPRSKALLDGVRFK